MSIERGSIIESEADAFARFGQLPVFYEVPDGLTYTTVGIDALRLSSGTQWSPRSFVSQSGRFINPLESDVAQKEYDEGVAAFRDRVDEYTPLLQADGRWWHYDRSIKGVVDNSLREVHN